jgi:multidrug efflux pump subunit AcrB
MNLQRSAKFGAAEVFIPVLAGTLTTLAPFFPLLFWPGVVGQFMGYLPATMIITLLASLFVAFVINPVFAVSFMKVARPGERKGYKQLLGNLGGIVFVAIILYLANQLALANFALTLAGLLLLTRFGIEPLISGFMRYILPGLERTYGRIVTWATHGRNAVIVLLSTVGLLVLSVVAIGMSDTKVTFFPESDPNFAYVYIDLPVGTDTQTTDSLTKEMEERVWQAIGKDTSIVEAMVTNVAVGAGDPRPTSFEQGKRPEKGKLSVAFVPYSKRGGVSSWAVLERIRKAVQGVPGAEISVEREQSGPPTGKPINIEVRGDNFEQLIHTSKRLRRFIDSAGVPGIENLQTDLELNKPEAIVRVDRERANRLGIQTATIGQALRTAINGTEVSKFREEDEQHPIILRLQEQYRENLSALQNLNITFRDRATGTFKQIPLSAVAEIDYTSSYGSVKRKDLKRVVTLSSNVKTGYNANEINRQIRQILPEFERPANFEIEQTGEQEEQQKAMEFLSNALIISVLLILFILTALFNAVGKVVIILSQVVFSIIGVLLGFAATGMELSVVMTGVGIVALAGIVVNNGILLLEFTDRLRARGVQTSQALIRGGEIRLRPVLLTATSTILGLVPLAIGFNIDFPGLFRSGEADIFFGGDSAAFWGPLAWTIIFGLLFATILTLVVVPAMYRIYFGIKFWQQRRRHQRRYRPGPEQLPLR